MKGVFQRAPTETAQNYLRRAGYARHVSADGEVSYVLRTSGYEFPRFHIYVDERPNKHTISIHLDQKAQTYDGFSAHSGEYDGPIVRHELARVASVVNIPLILQ